MQRREQLSVLRRIGSVTVLLLGCALLLSCGNRSADQPKVPADLSSLRGELVVPGDLLLVAGRGAEKASRGLFRFGNIGALKLFVARDLEGDFAVRLRVGERNASTPFNYRFADSTPVFNRLPDPNRWLTIPIPGPIEAGVHRVQLSVAEDSFIQIREAQVVETSTLAGSGSEAKPLVLDQFQDFESRSRVAGFLETGLTGEQPVRAGTLIYGDSEHDIQLELPDRGTFTGWLENLGRLSVSIDVRLGSERAEAAQLEPGQSLQVQLEATEGSAELSIAVAAIGDAAPGTLPLVLLGSPDFEPQRPLDSPPIILITLDTTRRDALAPFIEGAGVTMTPRLAEFARDATVFEAAFSVAPWTLPSHASMLTGLYPFEHGAGVRSLSLDFEFESAAELLQEAGFKTAGFVGGFLCHHSWGVGQGFNEYYNPDGFETSGEVLTERVLDFLDSAGDRPFFLFANYFDPHGLYRAPEEFRKASGALGLAERLPEESEPFRRLSQGEHEPWRALLNGELSGGPLENEYLRAEYDAEVSFMDQQLGRVFERLAALDLYERSLIVILADHGEMLGERGFYGHGARLDQEQVSIPFMIKFPHQPAASRVKQVVSSIDVFPTLLAEAGIEIVDDESRLTGARRLTKDGYASNRRVFVLQEEHNNAAHPLFGPMVLAPDVLGVQSVNEQFWSWDSGRLCQTRSEIGGDWSERSCESMAWPAEQFDLFEGEVAGPAPADEATVSSEEREALEALGYIDGGC